MKTNIFSYSGDKAGLMKKLEVACICENAPTIDELINHLGKQTGLKSLKYNLCPECETAYEAGVDARVDAGMKCGNCAYGYGD